ncbi:MAG: ribbon-helix-helix protein, CopG family [Methanobacteriota archaeon]
MSNLSRVTIALNKDTSELFEKLKADTRLSQSELLRNALWFYSKYKDLISIHGSKKINTYVEMLSEGEHIILDVDHWLLFLKYIETSPKRKNFWEACKAVARSHADQLSQKIKSVREFLERIEACNFYKLGESSENEFVLVLNSDVSKKFVKTLVQDVLSGMGYKVEIKEDFAKLRLRVLQ